MRLHDFFDFHVREHSGEEFAILGDRRLSYGQAGVEVHRLADALIASGLGKGDRIAILSRNRIEYLLLYLAGSKTGVVPVPLNYRLAPPEWEYIIRDSGARMILAESRYAGEIDSLRPGLETLERCISLDRDLPEWTLYSSWTSDRSHQPPECVVLPGDDFYQMYTSGTTGRPKGTVITQSAVTCNVIQVVPLLPELKPGDRYLLVAPVYHAAAAIVFFCCVFTGSSLFIQQDFEPAEVVWALSEKGLVGALLVPAMIQACLMEVPDAARRDYQTLRLITYGASPISESTLRSAMQTFRCDFTQGYGMTETTAVLSALGAEEHRKAVDGDPELLSSAGRPLMGTEMRIVDPLDRPLPRGQVGQIIARGPQLMRGYWNMPEATRDALAGGWMHTGDAGRMDEEGYLYIMDRVKDMIVSGGENVYPRAVEDVLFQHPGIADVAVIGVPHDKWGETVKAVVVCRRGSELGEKEVIEFCRGKLGDFQKPTSVDFMDELPRNPSGKVLKRVLREPYWQGEDRGISGS